MKKDLSKYPSYSGKNYPAFSDYDWGGLSVDLDREAGDTDYQFVTLTASEVARVRAARVETDAVAKLLDSRLTDLGYAADVPEYLDSQHEDPNDPLIRWAEWADM